MVVHGETNQKWGRPPRSMPPPPQHLDEGRGGKDLPQPLGSEPRPHAIQSDGAAPDAL